MTSNTPTVPFVDTAGYNSNHRFHVDGTNQNLLDAVNYLENVVEYADNFPETKTQYNDLMSWIKAFNYSYERIPKRDMI